MGIEPTIFRFEVGRLIHWATRPILFMRFNMTSSKEKHQHLSEVVSTYYICVVTDLVSPFDLSVIAMLPVLRFRCRFEYSKQFEK